MPISHKIRQYTALFGFAHPGKILWSVERAEEVAPKQGIWWGFMRQILIGSPRGLGIGLLEQSRSPSLVVPLELRLPGGYPHPSWHIYFLERGEGRERERERNISWLLPAHTQRGPNHKPDMRSDWDPNQPPFAMWDNARTTDPHQPGWKGRLILRNIIFLGTLCPKSLLFHLEGDGGGSEGMEERKENKMAILVDWEERQRRSLRSKRHSSLERDQDFLWLWRAAGGGD